MKVLRLISALSALIVLLVPLSSARVQAATHILVALNDFDGYEAYVARDMGWFQRAGLDVELQNFGSGAAVAAAVASQTAAIGVSNVITVAQAREHGLPFTFVAPASMAVSSSATAQFAVWPQGTIRSAKDLNGKTIGAETVTGLMRLASVAWIDRNGGDSTTVTFVEMSPGELVPALERGTIAAATLVEPLLTTDLPKVRALGNPFDTFGPRVIVTGWFSTNGWISQNRATATAFENVIEQAARWANDPKNKVQAAAYRMKYSPGHVEVGPTTYAVSWEPSTIQPLLDAATKYKLLTKPMTVDDLTFKAKG